MPIQRDNFQERRGLSKALFYLGKKHCSNDYAELNYEKGFKYLYESQQLGNRHAYDLLKKIFFELADKAQHQGNIDCQFYIGLMSLEGYYDKDIPYALKWFKNAAHEGHFDAQIKLYQLYLRGHEVGWSHQVKQNTDKALEWLTYAADRENTKAQYELGKRYCDGKDIEQDYERGLKYLKQSANANNADAQYKIGTTLLRLKDVPGELNKEADKWISKAANNGHVAAQMTLGKMYYSDTKEQNYQKAFIWYQKAADNGNCYAQLKLGNIYYLGHGVGKNYEKAWRWFKKAFETIPLISPYHVKCIHDLTDNLAKTGNAEAMFQLGRNYIYNEKLFRQEKNLNKGKEWLGKSADKGNANAQYHLGYMYCNGEYVEKNLEKAFELFRKAALKKHEHAQFELAQMYHKGNGVEKDYKKAFYLYEKAATKGHLDSQYNLGVLYFEGTGVEKDISKSEEWLCKAAVDGSYSAQNFLEKYLYTGSYAPVYKYSCDQT